MFSHLNHAPVWILLFVFTTVVDLILQKNIDHRSHHNFCKVSEKYWAPWQELNPSPLLKRSWRPIQLAMNSFNTHCLYSTSPPHQWSEKLIQDIPSILLFPYPDHQLQKKTWRAWRTGYVSDVTNITWCTSQQVTEIPGDSGASEGSEKFLAEFHDQLPHNFYLLWRFHV